VKTFIAAAVLALSVGAAAPASADAPSTVSHREYGRVTFNMTKHDVERVFDTHGGLVMHLDNKLGARIVKVYNTPDPKVVVLVTYQRAAGSRHFVLTAKQLFNVP